MTGSIEIDRKDVQQVRVMDDNDGNVWICARYVIEWEVLQIIDDENSRGQRVDVTIMEQEVAKIG